MPTHWFYARGGKKRGPFTTVQIRGLAAVGRLRPDDLLWPDGDDAAHAVGASAVIDYLSLPQTDPLPDWLSDVQLLEQVGPKISKEAHDLPEWVISFLAQNPWPGPRPGRRRRETAPTSTARRAPKPSEPPESVKTPPPVSVARQVSKLTRISRKRFGVRNVSAEAYLREAYQEALQALEVWTTLAVHRQTVLAGDFEAIRHDPAVLGVIQPFRRFGAGVVYDLWKHLVAAVEKRQTEFQKPLRKK